jgi:hypothetical protein
VTYYLQLDAEGAHQGIWKFNNTAVERVPPNDYNRNSFPITPGDSVEDTLGKLPEWSNHRFLPTTLAPGEYFPRMARPLFLQKDGHGRPFSPSYKLDEVAIFRGQLAVLTQQLEDICRVIHPTKETLSSSFGHEIRNLLILACTEVETHWRGVLQDNEACPERPTTQDYVRSSSAMKLPEYAVAYPNYPWLSPFRPFGRWSGSAPTEEIEWYDAYNSVII